MNRIFYMAMLLVTWLSFAPSYADDVAQIGSTTYSSLAEAIADVPANGTSTTITMLADHVLASGVTVAKNQSIVIDLAGHTVSGTVATKDSHTYLFTNKGTLEITDSSQGGTGRITYVNTTPDTGYSKETCTIYNAGNLTLTEGTVANTTLGGASYAVTTSSNAWGVGDDKETVFNMKGGTLTCPSGDQALRVYQNSADTTTPFSHNTVTISGGRILDTGIFLDNYIYQPKVNTTGEGISTNVTISGGEIHGLIDMKLRHTFHTSLAITGGTFVDSKFRVRKAGEWASETPEPTSPVFTISGGQFSFASGNDDKFSLNRGGGTTWTSYEQAYLVSGGVFSLELPTDGGVAYPAGKEVVANTDANTMEAYPWTVGSASVAQIGETKYASLAEAIAAVPTDGTQTTITMIADETVAGGSTLTIAATKNIVLDLNGKTITGSSTTSSPNFYFITNKGTLEITDNSEGALGKITYGCSAATYNNEYVTICNEGGTFTLTNGTIENTSGGLSYAVNNRSVAQGIATFKLNGGTISAPSGDAAIRVYQSVYNASSPYDNIVNVTGGTILNSGIFVDSYIGNNVDGSNSHLNVNISGGTVNGLIDYKLRHPYNIALNITGGTFVDSKLWVRKHSEWKNVVAEPTAPIVHISGGKFSFANNKAFGLAYDCGATSWTSYTQPYDVSDGVFNVNLNNFSGIAFPTGKTGVANTDSETSEAYPYTVGVAPVAQIGSTTYPSLAEAIEAVPTDGTQTTITMIADETIEGNTGVTVAANKNIVLDLNGHTVANQVNVNNTSWVIDNKGTLTVKDSSEGGNGKLKNALADGVTGGQWSNYNYSTSVINNKGTLNIQSGTLEQTAIGNISYTIDSTGEINITGGTISSANGAGIRMLCNSTSSTSSINMTAGTINAKWGVYIQNPNSNVPNNNGSMTVTGGTINAEKDCIFVDADTNWTSGLNATLSNGTFIAERSAIHMDGSKTLSGLYITGGNYTTAGDEAATAVISTGTGNSTLGVISGGLFNVSPNAAYIADGYVVVDNTDEATKDTYPYTVVPISYVAKIGDNDKYTTLAAAIAAVADGEEIKMIANSNENVLYDVTSPNLKNKTVTISGEYTLTSPDGSFGFYFGDYDNGNRPTTDKLNVSGITMAKSGGNYTTLFDGVTADLTNVTVNGDGNTALSYANGAVGTLTNVTVTNTGSHTQTWRNTALALQSIGSGTSEVTVKSGSYTSVNGYAVYMFSSGGTLNIEGGTFSGALMSQIDNNSYPDNQSIINISGGTFANCTLTESGGENAQIYVSGGTFSINPTAYVLPGYAAVETVIDNTTWWKVGEVVTGDMTKQDGATATQATYTVETQVVDGNEVLSTTTNTTVTVAIAGENNVAVDAELDDLKMDNVVSKSVKEVPGNDINVKIAVVATAETPAVENTLVFEVHPEATVYVSNVKQGTVELENSDLATGATFTFKLPVAGTFENGTEVKVVHKSSDPATYPDETFYATVSDGKVTITVSHFSDFELSEVIDYVAQVGDIKFTTLEAAFDYATQGSNNTVYMLHDVTIADKLIYNYPGTPKVTLHLNNHTLYGRTNIMGGILHIEYGHVVGGNQQALNVYGSSDPTAVDYSRLTIGDYVDVTADNYAICLFGATATSNGYGARVDIDGINATVSSVNDGTVFVSGNLGNGISGDQHNVVNINGTVTSTNNAAVALHGNATVNVQTYASITGHTGIAVKRGTLNVAGGTIVGNGEKNTTPAPNGNGTELTGAGISVSPTYSNYGPISVNISRGEANEPARVQSVHADALFKQEGDYVNDATIAVSGGIFSSEVPEEFCADGYRPIDHGNGIYSVTEIEYEAQLKHGETYVNYASLQDALAAAADGDEVYMMRDVTLSESLNVNLAGKAVTLDLGANTLTGRTNLKSGSLTLTNGNVAGGDQQALNVYGSSDPTATNYSVLTINNNVVVTADVYGVCMFGATASPNGYGAVVNINGRVLTGGDGKNGAVFVSGNLGKNISGDMHNVINIAGRVTSATDAAVALNGNATVNVQNGAEITGNTGIAVKRGTLNMTGGTIYANGEENTTPSVNNNGTEMTGAGISMSPTYSQYGPMSVVITGGEVQSVNAVALFKQAGTYQSDATFSVSGGLFSSEVPAEFCADGYQPKYDQASGKYTVATFAEIWADKDIVLIDGQSYEYCVGQTLTQDVVVNSVTYQRNVPNANTYCAWYVPADYRLTSDDLDQFDFYRINLIANAEGGNEVENTTRIWVYLFPMAADDVLTANRPYVFKTKGGTGQFTFTLENTLHAPATDVRLNNSTTAHNYDFYGTYETTQLSDKSSEHFFYVDYYGQMGWPGSYNINVGPYRWYIKTTQKGGGAYYAPTFVFTDDPNVTGITDNLEVKTIDCYYDLKGMKIEKPSKGAYLVKFKDGTVKKVVK